MTAHYFISRNPAFFTATNISQFLYYIFYIQSKYSHLSGFFSSSFLLSKIFSKTIVQTPKIAEATQIAVVSAKVYPHPFLVFPKVSKMAPASCGAANPAEFENVFEIELIRPAYSAPKSSTFD